MSMQTILKEENIVESKSLKRSWTVEETNDFLEALSHVPGSECVVLNPYNEGLLIPSFPTVPIPNTKNRIVYAPNPVETLLRSDIRGVKSCHSLSRLGQGVRAGNLGYLANPNWGTLWICTAKSKAELEFRSSSFHSRFSKFLQETPQPTASINYYIDEETKTVYLSRIYGNTSEVIGNASVIPFIKEMFLQYGYNKVGYFTKWWPLIVGKTSRLEVYDKAQIITKRPQDVNAYTSARYADLEFYSAIGNDHHVYCQELNMVVVENTSQTLRLKETGLGSRIINDAVLATTKVCSECGFTSSEINRDSYFHYNRCSHCLSEVSLFNLFDVPLLEEMYAVNNSLECLVLYADFDKEKNIRFTYETKLPDPSTGCKSIYFMGYRATACYLTFSPALSRVIEERQRVTFGTPLSIDYSDDALNTFASLLSEK